MLNYLKMCYFNSDETCNLQSNYSYYNDQINVVEQKYNICIWNAAEWKYKVAEE